MKKLIVGLAVIVLLCFIIMVLSAVVFRPSFAMRLYALTEKPSDYFTVTGADAVFSKAISQVGKSVEFGSLNDTRIDDLVSQYGTHNLEYFDKYYSVLIVPIDTFMVPLIVFFCLAVGIASITLMCLLFARRINSKRPSS